MAKRGPKTPEGKARALANLRQNREFHDMAGITAILPNQNSTKALAEKIIAVMEGEGFSHIRPADRISVNLLATLLRRIGQAERYLDEQGLVKPDGSVRPVADYVLRAVREARGLAESLGLSPAGRAKLGLDLAKGFDLARELARLEEDEDDGSQDTETVEAGPAQVPDRLPDTP